MRSALLTVLLFGLPLHAQMPVPALRTQRRGTYALDSALTDSAGLAGRAAPRLSSGPSAAARSRHTGRAALIGGGIGAAVGVVGGLVLSYELGCDCSRTRRLGWGAFYAVPTGVLGAVLGAAVEALRPMREPKQPASAP
jgi:hypothetical protein